MANKNDWSDISTYNGKKPFVFISYAHKDVGAVVPVIKSLQERGYRVWLDLGIEAGTEWANNIAAHLKDCAAFIVFISKNSMASENCLDEIAYAKSHQKPSLMVFLEEDVEIPEGIEMQTARFQRMYKSRHLTQESFVEKICEASFLESCKDAYVASKASEHKEEKKAANKNVWVLPIVVSIALAIAVIVMAVMMFFNGANDTRDGEQSTTEVTTTAPEEIVMSDNLLDFTVKINGVVNKFPCSYDELVAQGWTISTNNCSPDSKISGASNYEYYMANSGSKMSVTSYNLSGNANEIKNCLIGGVSWYFDEVDFEFPHGITANSYTEDIINAYGTPHELTERDEYDTLVYRFNGSYDNYVKFTVYSGENHYDYSYVTLCNYINDGSVTTDTNEARPEYLDDYVAPDALGDDLTAATVVFSGDLYRLPAPVSAFTDNGWKITSKVGYVVSGGNEYISMERNGEKMDVKVLNYAEYQTIPENCIIASLSMYSSDGISAEIPCGITFESSRADVEKACEGFEYYDGISHTYSCYTFDGGREFSLSINVSKETDKVSSISIYEYTWNY